MTEVSGEHDRMRQLYRCEYVVVRDWDMDHLGWWRLSWPRRWGLRRLRAERVHPNRDRHVT